MDIDSRTIKRFSRHLLECSNHCKHTPRFFTQMQDCILGMGWCAEQYRCMRENMVDSICGACPQEVQRLSEYVESEPQYREMSFSVKEDIELENPEVEIIEVNDAEQVSVISPQNSEKPNEDVENDLGSIQPSETEADPTADEEKEAKDQDGGRSLTSATNYDTAAGEDSDDSEVGIYFIDEVCRIRLINIIQRELCTLSNMFPSVCQIIQEISKEFEHFKVCCSCLKKISPILPDILKELQELIKFLTKKRNNHYSWPDDSDYLRKTTETSSKPFKKEDGKRKTVRQETVAFVTLQTNNRPLVEIAKSIACGHSVTNGRSQCIRSCPLITEQFPFVGRDSETVKINTAVDWDGVSVIEWAASQAVRVLHPEPTVEEAIQFRGRESLKYCEGDGTNRIPTLSINNSSGNGSSEKVEEEDSILAKTKEFLHTTKVAIDKVWLELKTEGESREEMEYERELKSEVRDLKGLMLEVHRNQIELSKVILDKGVLTPAVVQLTDPQMLHEERQGIEKAKNTLKESEKFCNGPKMEELQKMVDDLKCKCRMKNEMIVALLNSLRNNIPEYHWQELIKYTLHDSLSIQELAPETVSDFRKNNSCKIAEPNRASGKCQDWKSSIKKEVGSEEILSERQIRKTSCGRGPRNGRDSARVSFSEIIPKSSRCFHTTEPGRTLADKETSRNGLQMAGNGMDFVERKKLTRSLEREIIVEKSKTTSQMEDIKSKKETTEESVVTDWHKPPGTDVTEVTHTQSAAINIKIKIADQDLKSNCESAKSILSSALATEKSCTTTLTEENHRPPAQFPQMNSLPAFTLPRGQSSLESKVVDSIMKMAFKLYLPKPAADSNAEDNCRRESHTMEFFRGEETSLGNRTLGETCSSVTRHPSRLNCSREIHPGGSLGALDSNGGNRPRPCAGQPSSTNMKPVLQLANIYQDINVHAKWIVKSRNEHDESLVGLRSRLLAVDKDIKELKLTTDKMNLLADKLLDYALENSKRISDNIKKISGLLNDTKSLERLMKLLRDTQARRIAAQDGWTKAWGYPHQGTRAGCHTVRGGSATGVVPLHECRDFGDGNEWIDILKALSLAEDDVHHLQRTDTYLEARIRDLQQDLRKLRSIADCSRLLLTETSNMQIAFNKAVGSVIMTRERSREVRKVQFGHMPRKCRSEESSCHKNCGLILNKPFTKREKIGPKKGYGKFCSTCGVVEVSSQQSMFKCHDCNGEIIVQSVCSSCDTIMHGNSTGKASTCSTCKDTKRRKIDMEKCEMCHGLKTLSPVSLNKSTCVYNANQNSSKFFGYIEESSYCSDCDAISVSSDLKRGQRFSADSLFPCSASDDMDVGRHQDWEVASSLSSGTDRRERARVHRFSPSIRMTRSNHEQLSRVAEETLSMDEEFNTPLASMENLPENLDSESFEGKTVTNVTLDWNAASDSEEYSEAPETPSVATLQSTVEDTFQDSLVEVNETSSLDTFTTGEFVYPSELDQISVRMRRVKDALSDLSAENRKLEDEMTEVDTMSQQNAKLSAVLEKIMLGMALQLDAIHRRTHEGEGLSAEDEDSDGVEEFQEAVEHLSPQPKADSDADSFYDVPQSNHCYVCLRCGISISRKVMSSCSVCEGRVVEIPNVFLGVKPFTPAGDLDKRSLVQHSYPHNVNIDRLLKIFPMLLNPGPNSPLYALQKKMKTIEMESGLLKDSNDIISALIDDLQEKFKDDLNTMQIARVTSDHREDDNEESSEAEVFGFDLSFFKFCRFITDRGIPDGSKLKDVSVCQSSATFIEMKIEEIFKKEQQTALELEIIEQKLQVQGLIIKGNENFRQNNKNDGKHGVDIVPLAVTRRSAKDRIGDGKDDGSGNDSVLISIEIEVEKESKPSKRKSFRCEYKASLQMDSADGRSALERALPTITLSPWWSTADNLNLHAECITADNKKVQWQEVEGPQGVSSAIYCAGEAYGDYENDFLEIKSPKWYRGSSDDDTESCAGDCTASRRNRKWNTVAATGVTPFRRGSFPHQPVTPYAIVTPTGTEYWDGDLASAAVDASEGAIPVECVEMQSRLGSSVTSKQKPGLFPLIRFFPVNMGGITVASMAAADEKFPIVIIETLRDDRVSRNTKEPSGPDPILEKALTLIREIESDVVKVNFSNAIEILPQLESVLREHIRDNMCPESTTTMAESNLDAFLSALTFLTNDPSLLDVYPPQETKMSHETEEQGRSQDKISKTLYLLTGLEDAVKSMNDGPDCRSETQANKIYELLKSLSEHIKEVWWNMSEMKRMPEEACAMGEPTAQSTAQGGSKKFSVDRAEVPPQAEGPPADSSNDPSNISSKDTEWDIFTLIDPSSASTRGKDSSSKASISGELNLVKKKIFDAVASEAQAREERIEKDFERIEQLKKENAEVLLFLDTLLDKTLRRVYELDEVKGMAECMRELTEEYLIILQRHEELSSLQCQTDQLETSNQTQMETSQTDCQAEIGGESSEQKMKLPSILEASNDEDEDVGCVEKSAKEKPAQGTLSSLMVALDELKSRAIEKKARYNEIFGERDRKTSAKPLPVPNKNLLPEGASSCHGMTSKITQFSKVGTSNFFMSWSKPEVDNESCSLVGYEILVNGKMNQRVRNPDRLKAVLYSVSPEEHNCIKLYALMDDGHRRSLTEIKYPAST